MDTASSPSPLMSYPQAADYLKVSVSTLRRRVKLRQIPVILLSERKHLFHQRDLDEYRKLNPRKEDDDPFGRLDLKQAAAALHLNDLTLRRMAKSGKIRTCDPPLGAAGKIYFLPKDLEKFLSKNTVKAIN